MKSDLKRRVMRVARVLLQLERVRRVRMADLRSLPLETDLPGDIISKTEDRLEIIATGLEGIALVMMEPEKSNVVFDQKRFGKAIMNLSNKLSSIRFQMGDWMSANRGKFTHSK